MTMMSYLKSSLLASAWFVFLTFPLLVVKVNTLKGTVQWRWINMLWVGLDLPLRPRFPARPGTFARRRQFRTD
jgi:hypothetical protein